MERRFPNPNHDRQGAGRAENRRIFAPARSLTVAALLLICILGAAGPRRADPPSRYKLRVGDWLVYEHRAESVTLDSGKLRHQIVDQIQLWCFEKNDDELLILLDLIHMEDGRREPMRGVIFHLNERGQKKFPPESQTRLAELDAAFDTVPTLRSAIELGPDWLAPPDLYGRRWRCAPAAPDGQHPGWRAFDFTVEDPTGAAELLGQTRRGRFWLDPAAGLVTRVESREEDRAAGLRTDTVLVLRHRTQNEDRWCAQRAAEARRWLLAQRGEDRLIEDVFKRAIPVEEATQRLDRHWSEFLRDIDNTAQSPFEVLGNARRRRLPAEEAALRARARVAERWLGKPAPPWSLQDAAGRTVASETLRGEVTVECLWSAESPWGPRMLDTVRRLQEELGNPAGPPPGAPAGSSTGWAGGPSAGPPVRVICLNMDNDPARAARAMQRCGAGLTNVLASPLRNVEPALELPAVRVLDQRGTVRAVVFGWRPSLRETVAPLMKRP